MTVPAFPSADAERVFRENRRSVTLVTAYNKKGQPLTEGTGFILSSDGAVITNYHVIGIAKDIKVKTGGRYLDVEGVTYADRGNDIVILKVKGKGLPAVKLGNVRMINAGEKVYIISDSEDTGNVIYEGIFRKIETIYHGGKVIEISAPVSHGSSGSPLFNRDGQVIGIATFLMKRTVNLIFAMPSELFKDKFKSNSPVTPISVIIKNYQNTAEYWFYLGYYLSEAGAHKEAIDVFREAIRLKPDYADAYYYLGAACEKLGKNKEAVKAYSKAIKLRPDFADAHLSLGSVYGKLGMYKEAVDVLMKAAMTEPDFADVYYNLGVAYGKLGMYGEGIEADKKAVKLNPGFADAYYNMGIAYEKSGLYKEAVSAFQKFLKLRPDNADAHYNLGILHVLLKDIDSAMERYRTLKNLDASLAEKLLGLIQK
ncbi:MAG: serine protease [Nitrospirae bacterium]|nr:serine protease [Nitrospirota bacterium]